MNGGGGANKITVYFIIGFLILVTVGVVVAGVVSNSSSPSTDNASSTFNPTTVPAITSSDWSEGNPNAPVSLIEYGDFECPACGAYFPVIQQLQSDFGNQLRFVFRNYPLYQVHPDAGLAAEAAEAAGMMGQYWPMHDLLYKNQDTWSAALPTDVVNQYFNGYAQSLGLNVDTFDTDMNSKQVAAKIQADVTSGDAALISYTPTFFLNLKQIENPASYDAFKAVIDQALGISSSSTSSTGATVLPTVITTTSTAATSSY